MWLCCANICVFIIRNKLHAILFCFINQHLFLECMFFTDFCVFCVMDEVESFFLVLAREYYIMYKVIF